ncbi:MAG: hypothetical protein HS116_03660 [Planctomycetes bacterium]|nr:hypothetical protein [Planctomycetota bacterium]
MSEAGEDYKAIYDEAEAGWKEMLAGVEKVQAAAAKLKKSERSIDGYNIERALFKHKPDLIKQHLEGLLEHRKEENV